MTIVHIQPEQADLVQDLRELLEDAIQGKIQGVFAVVVEASKDEEIIYPWVSGYTDAPDATCWQITKLARIVEEASDEEDSEED